MTITLPDEMKDELEHKAREAGFMTVEQFVLHTLQNHTRKVMEDLNGMPVPGELLVKDRDDLEAKILEGINSGPPIRVTPEFWNTLRRRAEEQALPFPQNQLDEATV
jgi:hypothetical protein